MAIIKKNDIFEQEVFKAYDEIIKKQNTLIEQEKELLKVSKKRQTEFQKIAKTSDGPEAKKLVKVNNELIKNNKDLTALQKERIKVNNQLKVTQAKLLSSREKNTKVLAKGRVQLQKRNKLLKQVAREELGLVDATEKLTKARNEAQRALKNNIILYGENSRQAKQAKKEFQALEKQFQRVNTAANDGRPNVGRYGLALKGVGQQLLGAAGIIGGVDLLVSGFQNFAQTAREVNELTRKIGTNFGLAKDEAKAMASNVRAIASTFDEDYNQILQAATAVSKEFGITGQQATGLIEEGFLKGSNNSGEFLDILREYPVQLKSIGLNASESFAIINQQVTKGVYSDKGIDALKEAGIRLRENNKAVQESLQVFNEDTQAQIKNAVARGDVFKATQLISEGLQDNSLTAQQVQEVISNVFGGAGEDAQSFIFALNDIDLSLQDVKIQASEVQLANLELSKSWNNFVSGVEDGSGIISRAWAGLLRGISNILGEITNLNKGINAYTQAQKDAVGATQVIERSVAKLDKTLSSIESKEERISVATEKRTFLQKKLAEENQKLNAVIESGHANAERITRVRIDLIQAQIDKTNEFIPVQASSSNKIDENSAIREKNSRVIKDQNDNLLKQIQIQQNIKSLQDRGIAETDKGEEDFLKIQESAQRELDAEIAFENKKAEEILEIQDKLAEDQLALDKALFDARAELQEDFLNATSSLAKDIIDADAQQKIDAANAEAEAEKDILRQQLEDGVITEEEFRQKTAEADKKAKREGAKAEKRSAIYKIGVDTAAAVVKALGSAAPPFNFINAGLVAAQGAIQAALVAAKPLPAFSKGTESVPLGNNKKGKDTILARVDEGERIIPKLINNKIPSNVTNDMVPELINRGLNFDMPKEISKSQRDGLLATLLMQGNKKSDEMITALMNLSSIKDFGSYIMEIKGSGQIFRYNK
jgi:hypothetical protein